jgi:hypothetical protein
MAEIASSSSSSSSSATHDARRMPATGARADAATPTVPRTDARHERPLPAVSATLPGFRTFHVVDEDRFRRFQRGDTADDDDDDAVPKRYTSWAQRRIDFRRSLETLPWYRQALMVASYAGMELEDIVYVPSASARRRRTYGSGSIDRRRSLLLGRGDDEQARASVPGAAAPERGDAATAERLEALEALTEQLRGALARFGDENDRLAEAGGATRLELDAALRERAKLRDEMRALEEAVAGLRTTLTEFPNPVTLRTQLAALTTSLDVLRKQIAELSKQVKKAPEDTPPPPTTKTVTNRLGAAPSSTATTTTFSAAVSGARYSNEYTVALLDLERELRDAIRDGTATPALLERVRAQRDVLALLAAIEDQRAAVVEELEQPLKAPETTGIVFTNPAWPAHQQLALTMVRQRYPQTLARASIDAFERSTTCDMLFALLTASLFSTAGFISGSKPQRASDYGRIGQGGEYAMLQLRYARLDTRTNTVEMVYADVAEHRNAIASRRPECARSLRSALVPYSSMSFVDGSSSSSSSSPHATSVRAQQLRTLVLSARGFEPLAGSQARGSPYGSPVVPPPRRW